MKPVEFPQQHLVIGKPVDWTDEQCVGLPAWIGNVQDRTLGVAVALMQDAGIMVSDQIIDSEGTNAPAIVSKWEFTDEEFELMRQNRCLYLQVCGEAMPPVLILPYNPFK